MMKMTSELADKHYVEHVAKGFYPELKTFMTGGPIVAHSGHDDTEGVLAGELGGRAEQHVD